MAPKILLFFKALPRSSGHFKSSSAKNAPQLALSPPRGLPSNPSPSPGRLFFPLHESVAKGAALRSGSQAAGPISPEESLSFPLSGRYQSSGPPLSREGATRCALPGSTSPNIPIVSSTPLLFTGLVAALFFCISPGYGFPSLRIPASSGPSGALRIYSLPRGSCFLGEPFGRQHFFPFFDGGFLMAAFLRALFFSLRTLHASGAFPPHRCPGFSGRPDSFLPLALLPPPMSSFLLIPLFSFLRKIPPTPERRH